MAYKPKYPVTNVPTLSYREGRKLMDGVISSNDKFVLPSRCIYGTIALAIIIAIIVGVYYGFF